MVSLGKLIYMVLSIYLYIIIAAVLMHWLYYFRVINSSNQFVRMVGQFLFSATEPVYRRIRRFIPTIGQFDISPLILILLIIFAQMLIEEYWINPLLRYG